MTLSNQDVQQVADALAKRLTGKREYGLIQYRRYRTIYVNQDNDDYFFYLVNNGNVEPQYEVNAIRGKLIRVDVNTEIRREKEVSKTHFLFGCGDENYRLELGSNTVTCKSLLFDLEATPQDTLKKPITAAIKRGTGANFMGVIEAPYKDRSGQSYDLINADNLVALVQEKLQQNNQ